MVPIDPGAICPRIGHRIEPEWLPIVEPSFVRRLIAALRDQRPGLAFLDGTGGLGGDVYLETFGNTLLTPRDMMVRGTLQANGGDATNGDGGHASFAVELQNNASFGSRILVDADHAVSSGLGYFTTDWSGSDAEQNVPTILIIDEDGILRFKYMSQNTVDRPSLEYLVWFLDVLGGGSP